MIKYLGRHWSYNLNDDPKRIGFVLARYRFAACMACKDKRVLELGCSEGLGAPVLSKSARSYTGVDMDRQAISAARSNFNSRKTRFIEGDFLGRKYGRFDTVISLDVIEHINKRFEAQFFDSVKKNLSGSGACVIGTPNLSSERYASPTSRLGHVNLYSADRLKRSMLSVFRNVFVFGMNDEVVHTGFSAMAHYLIAIGCAPRGTR